MFILAKKYSYDLKLTVVREYQEGQLGIRPLAKKHGIGSKSVVHGWIKVYERFGAEGLKRKNKTYSVQFRLDVLSFMKRTGFSQTETALHFGITEPTIISSWKKAILKGKDEGLNIHKGRPPMSKNNKTDIEMTYKQKLERENELLRLEVEYLKKLRAFQMDPKGYLEKHKQQFHSNSKKSSD